jgi:hypothetical protein
LHRLHARLGCHNQYSIPIGFFYAKWSEKLHFYLSTMKTQGSRHSSPSASRSRTPSPKIASTSTRSARDPSRSPNPSEKSPTIAPSSAANPRAAKQKIEEAEEQLNDIREKRAAIFDDTKDGQLKMEQKSVFRYRQARRAAWKLEDSMLNEQEWNDRHDREQLEQLQKEEEQLEMLLAKLAKSIGHGPAGQGSN